MGSQSGGGSVATTERIARHQHAAEVLRARSVLLVACLLWAVVGFGQDLYAFGRIGTGSLRVVLGARVVSSVFHTVVLALLYRRRLPGVRASQLLVASVFPVTSVCVMVMATQMGGLTSPYVAALLVGVMVQALAAPMRWQRGAILVAITIALYLGGLLVAALVVPLLAAQLADPAARTVFVVEVATTLAGGVVVAWGGHVVWSLRQSVFESRNIGRYRLAVRIGQGGMGEVWRAHDRALRRDVALKILSPESGRNPAAVARFEREIQATSEVAHPNVVRIHDWGVTDDGVWYYAMDLLAGVDLSSLVARCGPLPPALVAHLGAGVASGLAEAHRRGVLHRDLKPGNLFVVAPDGEPLRIELIDFGVAQIDTADALTQVGAIIGTPAYMAPEVLSGVPAGIATEVYGLAATLFFALTGKSPRDAGGVSASAIVDDVPVALDDLLARCLDAEPSRRPTGVDEIEHALVRLGLAWTGSFRIDRAATVEPVADRLPDVSGPLTVQEVRPRAATS